MLLLLLGWFGGEGWGGKTLLLAVIWFLCHPFCFFLVSLPCSVPHVCSSSSFLPTPASFLLNLFFSGSPSANGHCTAALMFLFSALEEMADLWDKV